MTLLNYVKNLNYNFVPYQFKDRLLSQYNFCHQNCEEYCIRNENVQIVHGWIEEKNFDGIVVKYLLHSCIREDGVLVDITPWLQPQFKGRFAIDVTVEYDDDVVDEFVFRSAIYGVLPLFIS